MHKKILIILFLFIFLFKFSYSEVERCAFISRGSPFGPTPYNGPPIIPDPPLTPGVCLFYSSPACCFANQTLEIEINMKAAEMIFGKCSACIQNMFTLWCAFTCSPHQGTFVNVTGERQIFQYEVVEATTYTLHPLFAQQLYDSCKWTTMEGGVVVHDAYATYSQFLNYMGQHNPQMTINFEFDEATGHNAPVIPCNDEQYFCSCSNCEPSCKTAGVKLNLTESEQCHIKMFGEDWLCLEVGMALGYYVFVVAALIAVSFITTFIAKGNKNHYEPLYENEKAGMGARNIGIGFGIAVILVGGGLIISALSTTHMKSNCKIQIFNSEWMCLSVHLLLAGMVLILFGAIVIAITNCCTYKHLLPRTKVKSDKNADHLSIDDLNFIQKLFYKLGHTISHHPKLVVFICLLIVAGLGVGIMKLEIIEQPEQLWVPPGSRSAVEKDYFDKMFGPFYRIEQLIITSNNETDPKMVKLEILEEILILQQEIMAITFPFNSTSEEQDNHFESIYFNTNEKNVNKIVNITIEDLCYKPIIGQGCIVESPLEFWQSNNYTLYHGIHSHGINASTVREVVEQCTAQVLNLACMSSIGAPNQPDVVFGGFNFTTHDYVNSTALSITWLLNNYPENRTVSRIWEEKMLEILTNRKYKYIRVSYSAQRSVQDELTREDSADVLTIIISYLVMFVYVSVSLGNIWPLCGGKKPLVVRTKFFLGLGGVLMVVFSVIMAVGFSSLIGVRATLIISEVIPFLVLAIGVDNIFILVNTLQTMNNSSLKLNERIARTLAIAGPSITLASISEALAFLLGAFTKMPAVQAFAIYASFAIFFDFLLQITCFVALMTMDARRTMSNRVDCIPCVKVSSDDEEEELEETKKDENSDDNVTPDEGVLRHIIEKYYAPFLFHPVVKVIVVILFVGIFFGGLCFFTSVDIGLNQQVALPKDSYLQDYFSNMTAYLAVGPPVYIVIKEGYNYTKYNQQNDICASLTTCHNNSLMNIINVIPYMNGQTYAWLDDYLRWAQYTTCCLEYEGEKCSSQYKDNHTCKTCYQLDTASRPNVDQFYKYLPWFLYESTVDQNVSVPLCAITGEAYMSDISFENSTYIKSSRLRSYHTILKNQSDYINALKVAYEVTDEINKNPDFNGMQIFPYSVFYIFFEQYLYIQSVAVMVCGLALLGIFVVTFILLGSPIASIIIVILVAMIEIDLIGAMYLWHISLNAVSVVNMVMAIGISVEFCVHITHSFCKLEGTRSERAMKALIETGSSILSGITLTKFFGVIVLAFSPSEIFEIYYFRMYLLIVLLGASHGLILLPVILSWFGPNRGTIYDQFKNKNNQYTKIN